MYLNKFGLGSVLSKRFESAPGSKIQDPRCPEKLPEHLGSWILDPGALLKRFESASISGHLGSWIQGRFESALKAHPQTEFVQIPGTPPGKGAAFHFFSNPNLTHT